MERIFKCHGDNAITKRRLITKETNGEHAAYIGVDYGLGAGWNDSLVGVRKTEKGAFQLAQKRLEKLQRPYYLSEMSMSGKV